MRLSVKDDQIVPQKLRVSNLLVFEIILNGAQLDKSLPAVPTGYENIVVRIVVYALEIGMPPLHALVTYALMTVQSCGHPNVISLATKNAKNCLLQSVKEQTILSGSTFACTS